MIRSWFWKVTNVLFPASPKCCSWSLHCWTSEVSLQAWGLEMTCQEPFGLALDSVNLNYQLSLSDLKLFAPWARLSSLKHILWSFSDLLVKEEELFHSDVCRWVLSSHGRFSHILFIEHISQLIQHILPDRPIEADKKHLGVVHFTQCCLF